MDVKDAIISRRSIFKFKQEPVPNDVIEQIFSYGIWAPNHHITEPWRVDEVVPNALTTCEIHDIILINIGKSYFGESR